MDKIMTYRLNSSNYKKKYIIKLSIYIVQILIFQIEKYGICELIFIRGVPTYLLTYLCITFFYKLYTYTYIHIPTQFYVILYRQF